MGGRRTTTSSTSNVNQTQNTTTPGTAPGTELIPFVNQTVSDAMGIDPYSGPRVAAPDDLTQQATWGAAPDTFVPTRTTADDPFQVHHTYVAPNAQEGIDAGMTAAADLNTRIPGLVNLGFDRWDEILQGGGNPNLDALIDAIQRDSEESFARNRGDRALYAGAEGAFGGTGYNQGEAWASEQEADALARAIAELRASDYYNQQQLLQAAPGALAGLAGVANLPAEMFNQWGGLRQENLIGAAASGDYNNQVDANNAWLSGTLNDSNAAAMIQDALARLQYNFAADSQVAANELQANAIDQQQEQAGYDNDYLNWLAQWEGNQAQQNALGNAMNIFATIPGADSTLTGRTQTTSTTRENSSPLSTLGGVLGAGLQMFAPGGMFSGSLSALGGLLGRGSGQSTGMTQAPATQAISPWLIPPQPTLSDIRYKKNIKFLRQDERGVNWYQFEYPWSKKPQVGVMAQELEQIAPELVGEINGMKYVDYKRLGAWMP